jgi:hypothetical protein
MTASVFQSRVAVTASTLAPQLEINLLRDGKHNAVMAVS